MALLCQVPLLVSFRHVLVALTLIPSYRPYSTVISDIAMGPILLNTRSIITLIFFFSVLTPSASARSQACSTVSNESSLCPVHVCCQ